MSRPASTLDATGEPSPPPTTHTARVTRRRGPRSWVRGGGLSTLVFLLPLLVVFGIFSWGPIVQSVVMSVQQTNLVTAAEFVGLENFTAVLSDPLLWTAVRNTLWFAALALLFGYPVPLLAAVLISEVRKRRGLFAALAYLPVVVPPVVAVLLWKFFFDASPNGVFNTILGTVGLGPLQWLQDTDSAMPSLVLEATWAAAGGTMIIYLAALAAVPPELYEAAEIDGASILRRIWHVTLPRLRSVVLLLMLLQIISTLQVFAQPFVMTDGGPNDGTITVLMLIYQYAFKYGDYGMAAALSMVLAVVLAVVSAVYLRLTRSWSTE